MEELLAFLLFVLGEGLAEFFFQFVFQILVEVVLRAFGGAFAHAVGADRQELPFLIVGAAYSALGGLAGG